MLGLARYVTHGGSGPSLNYNFVDGGTFPSAITFSRGSNATQFDSSGNLVYAPANLLVRSEDFATTWSALNITPSTDTSLSPAGTLTADTLTPPASTAAHLVSQSVTVTASASYIASVFVKTDGAPFVQVVYDNGASVGAFINVDLTTGAITRGPELAGGATNVTGSAVAVGNGYYRISVGATHTGTTGRVLISPLPSGQSTASINPSTTTAATDKIIVWGAQLNPTPVLGGITGSLSTYYPTTASAYYGPRLDYDPATLLARGFLVEEQRTNSIRNSTMQGAVAGTPGTAPTNWTISTGGATTVQIVGTGTENGITYIDYRFQGTGAADTWNLIYDSSVVAANGQAWTGSIYLKLAGGSTANLPFIKRLVFRDSGFANIQQLDSSALTPTGAGLSTQRNTLSSTATQAATAFVTLQLNSGTPTGAYNTTLRIGLPQLEQGAFATSVIPTTTTALTRNADVATVTPLGTWYNTSAGTLYVEIVRQSTTGYPGRARFSDGTANNAIDLYYDAASNSSTFEIKSGGSPSVQIYGGGGALNTVVKAAAAWETNNAAVVYAGAVQGTDTSVVVPSGINQLRLANALTGYIRNITYYPRRLPDATLQQITA